MIDRQLFANVLTPLNSYLFRRALERAARDANRLHALGLVRAEAPALARELHAVVPATAVTRRRRAEIVR